MCDFVHDSGSADGVNHRCMSSGCKKMGNDSIELLSHVSEQIFPQLTTDNSRLTEQSAE